MSFDVVILGGGVSGTMMAKRLELTFPQLHTVVIDRKDVSIHPFHIHRPIDLPGLNKLKPAILKTNVWDGVSFKGKPTLRDVNQYSLKLFGFLQVSNLNNMEDQTIYPVTKSDLLHLLSSKATQMEGVVTGVNLQEKKILCDSGVAVPYRYLVNTLPLPTFLKMANLTPRFAIESHPFWTMAIDLLGTGMYQMIYNCDSECAITRTTLLGDTLFVEAMDSCLREKDLEYLVDLYHLSPERIGFLKEIRPGRLKLLSQEDRKPLLHYLTERWDVFCLGRFGAWTYKIANSVWDDTAFLCDLMYAKEQAVKYQQDEVIA